MASYRHKAIAELSHQLKLSPVRLRLRQLEAAEYLVDLIEPDKHYPYDFLCHQLTGYRPKNPPAVKPMSGKTVIEDLVQLVEELSAAITLPVGALKMACWTTEELADRLKVSTKTICRWRRRGLPGRRMRYPDGSVRMTFLERSIRRFTSKNIDLVRRGAAFKQLSSKEKKAIVEKARTILAERRMRLHELSQTIAADMGRAVETVRYTLRKWDQAHPEEALFANDDQPVIKPELQAVYDEIQAGERPIDVARRYKKSVEWVETIVREVRARLLKAREIGFIDSDEFHTDNAEELILAGRPAASREKPGRVRPPKDLPPYLQELYRQPLLGAEQERDLFRRYNYLKFKAHELRDSLDVLTASDEQLKEIEQLLAQAERLKNEILRANLRLVVSIARKHVNHSPHFFEIVSDGNIALMRAVEKFDYARGYKFSTYASWAIMRNYARSIPEQMYHTTKMVTGVDEVLSSEPSTEETGLDTVLEGAKYLVGKGLDLLTKRERDIVQRHYGLGNNGEEMTLDQIGKQFGVTKERVRQIERRALSKIRSALQAEHAELIRD